MHIILLFLFPALQGKSLSVIAEINKVPLILTPRHLQTGSCVQLYLYSFEALV